MTNGGWRADDVGDGDAANGSLAEGRGDWAGDLWVVQTADSRKGEYIDKLSKEVFREWEVIGGARQLEMDLPQRS